MSDFVSDLPPAVVDTRLREAVTDLRRAEQHAVLWFADLMQRRLYRDCGYSSIHAYAEAALGFSEAKTYQFIRLAESLERLPGLRASVATGQLSWTKARSVATVATPSSEAHWVAVAKQSSSRELESRIRECRRDASANPRQSSLLPPAEEPRPQSSPKVQLSFSLEPEQHARWQVILEHLRKQGHGEAREELLLAAFSALAEAECTRVQSAPPYQVVIYRCEACGGARLPDGRPLVPALAAQAACDCREQRPGVPNRASIPPALRRAVLARDGHRCQAPGCRATRFLEVHHREARRRGGGNDAENLVTLCGACHRLLHQGGSALAAVLPPPG